MKRSTAPGVPAAGYTVGKDVLGRTMYVPTAEEAASISLERASAPRSPAAESGRRRIALIDVLRGSNLFWHKTDDLSWMHPDDFLPLADTPRFVDRLHEEMESSVEEYSIFDDVEAMKYRVADAHRELDRLSLYVCLDVAGLEAGRCSEGMFGQVTDAHAEAVAAAYSPAR